MVRSVNSAMVFYCCSKNEPSVDCSESADAEKVRRIQRLKNRERG